MCFSVAGALEAMCAPWFAPAAVRASLSFCVMRCACVPEGDGSALYRYQWTASRSCGLVRRRRLRALQAHAHSSFGDTHRWRKHREVGGRTSGQLHVNAHLWGSSAGKNDQSSSDFGGLLIPFIFYFSPPGDNEQCNNSNSRQIWAL